MASSWLAEHNGARTASVTVTVHAHKKYHTDRAEAKRTIGPSIEIPGRVPCAYEIHLVYPVE